MTQISKPENNNSTTQKNKTKTNQKTPKNPKKETKSGEDQSVRIRRSVSRQALDYKNKSKKIFKNLAKFKSVRIRRSVIRQALDSKK